MFIVETSSAKAARKMSVVMALALPLTASFGLLLTMHFYATPRARAPGGFRLFGFPRPQKTPRPALEELAP
jgi:hypothetical protein